MRQGISTVMQAVIAVVLAGIVLGAGTILAQGSQGRAESSLGLYEKAKCTFAPGLEECGGEGVDVPTGGGGPTGNLCVDFRVESSPGDDEMDVDVRFSNLADRTRTIKVVAYQEDGERAYETAYGPPKSKVEPGETWEGGFDTHFSPSSVKDFDEGFRVEIKEKGEGQLAEVKFPEEAVSETPREGSQCVSEGSNDIPDTRTIFVASLDGRRPEGTKGGNVGGVEGADDICGQAVSDSSTLSGTYKALLSTTGTSVKELVRSEVGDDVECDAVKFVNTQGDTIEIGCDRLWDGLRNPVRYDENGGSVEFNSNTRDAPLTGTEAGTGNTDTFGDEKLVCEDWTRGEYEGETKRGTRGNPTTTATNWMEESSPTCQTPSSYIYCFEAE